MTPFTGADRDAAAEAVARAAKAIECVVCDGIETAMNQHNG